MTMVEILPVPTEQGSIAFHAVAGNKISQGETAGEALDALMPMLADGNTEIVIVLQSQQPDQYFSSDQKLRLATLMTHLRDARDQNTLLPEHEKTELEELIDAELRASAKRSAALAEQLGK